MTLEAGRNHATMHLTHQVRKLTDLADEIREASADAELAARQDLESWRDAARMIATLYAQEIPFAAARNLTPAEWQKVAEAAGRSAPMTRELVQRLRDLLGYVAMRRPNAAARARAKRKAVRKS